MASRRRLTHEGEIAVVGLRAQDLRVGRDVGGLREAGGVGLDVELGELPVDARHELVGRLLLLRRRSPGCFAQAASVSTMITPRQASLMQDAHFI